MKHPDVAEVAVVGVPDPGHGESVRADVVPRPELWSEGSWAPEGLTEPELVQYCGRYLARYKLPAGEFREGAAAVAAREGAAPGAPAEVLLEPGFVSESTKSLPSPAMADRFARRIPEPTVVRLPVYQRALLELVGDGVPTVSSAELAEAAGVNAAKVRKDLSHLGTYGTPGHRLRRQLPPRPGAPRARPRPGVAGRHRRHRQPRARPRPTRSGSRPRTSGPSPCSTSIPT